MESRSLALFTTYGMSLSAWARIGTISRELALYRKLVAKGWRVEIYSFDRPKALPSLANWLQDGLVVRTRMPNWLPGRLFFLYALLLPFLYLRAARRIDVIKTNQAHSAWHALWATLIWRKPLVARSGYVLGEQMTNRKGERFGLMDYFRRISEAMVMRRAAVCFVPAEHLSCWCKTHYGCKNVEVVPNNIDLDLFKRSHLREPSVRGPATVMAVGRLHPCKRLDLLVRAAAGLDVSILLAGMGQERQRLERLAVELNVPLKFLGRIENDKLPELLHSADAFVICSAYEGHPKSLLEAMACGCCCVGTDSPGIRHQIRDGDTGLICEGTSESLRAALIRVLNDQELRERLSRNASEYAEKMCSLERLSEKEDRILREIVAGGGDHA